MKPFDENGAWFREFVQDLPALVWAKDGNGCYVFVNTALTEALGVAESSILGRKDVDLFSKEIAERFNRNDEMALSKGSAVRTVEEFFIRKGTNQSFSVTRFPITDSEGRTLVAGTAIEVLDQRTHPDQVSSPLAEPTSEDNYRTVFESIDEGFCVVEVLFNEKGHAVDYRFLEVNPVFEQSTGLANAIGKTALELVPDLEPFWIETYGEIARTGKTVRFENFSEPMDRWFDVHASKVGSGRSNRVAIVFRDVTERKRHESNLAFLTRINEDLAELSSIAVTMDELGAKIAEHFGLSLCLFIDIDNSGETGTVNYGWHAEDMPKTFGPHRIKDFIGSEFQRISRKGEVCVVRDVQADPLTQPEVFLSFNICSFITVPLLREGKWCFTFGLYRSEPYDWRLDQIELVKEIASRIWTCLERARAEEELRKSEERFRVMIENLPGGAVFVVDRDFRYLLADGEALEAAKVRREDLVGRTIFEVLAPEMARDYAKNYKAVLDGGHFTEEHAAHGRTFISRGTPLRDDHGHVYAVLAVSYDITDRKVAEIAIRESEARFRNMADHAPVMIWVTDERGRCTYLSQSWYEFTGQTEETGLGPGFANAIHPEDREGDMKEFSSAVERHEPFYTEHRLRRADGSYGWMICSAHPRFSHTGEFFGHIGSVLEITDRKIAEERIRESRDLNQSVIDSLPAHIAVLDQQGTITLVNSAWRTFAAENEGDGSIQGASLGMNYLTVCEKAATENALDEAAIYEGIKDVLDRNAESFSLEYPCNSPTAERWFLITVSQLIGGGAVVSHLDITERRLGEKTIRDTAERLSLAQKAGGVGIWDWSAASGLTYWSEEMWALYGVEPRDENPNESFWPDHLHEDDRTKTLTKVAEILSGSETNFEDEFRIVKEGGEIRWIASSATIERSDDGRPTRMYGVNIDITDRKAIEERIRASETQVRMITDSIPALVSYIDRKGRYLFVNRRYTQWFGREEERILGYTMTDVLGPAAVERLRPFIEKALLGERVDFETWLDYKVAGRRFVHVSYVPDLSGKREVSGFYALVTDLTDQRRSEELLRTTEERMKVLTDSFTDYAIISTDPAGIIESWNPGAQNIFGYAEDEIIGVSAEKLFTPEDVKSRVPEKEMRNARELGRASDERWHMRKDGSRFFASGVMAPLFQTGELIGYAKIATDLTEKRLQAENLLRAYEELENRVRERTQELGSANDSLREQTNKRLSGERQRIRLLQRLVTTQEEERKRIARDLHDQLGQRLTALRLKLAALSDTCVDQPELYARVVRLQQIAELLDSEVSFLTWQLRPTALDELGLADALRTFVGEWSRHYNKLADFHVEGVEELDISSDVETQVYRIAQEALNNVIKHAEAEGVSVILEKVGRLLVLIVEDNGVGFDLDSLERRPEDKHGVGLAGMRERAELIGGEIEMESTPGSGTTIYLRIPVDAPAFRGQSYE